MAIPKIKQLDEASGKSKNVIKGILIAVLALLLGAFGLEASNNDFDMGSLISGKSLSESKVLRDKDGNVVESGGKYTDEYNCDDFETQPQAQKFFTKAGGPSKDTNRLDGDNDKEACESLRKTESENK
ncbi:MAG TPA: excalibur calcium-binding domain-containing protein [Candidatus Limnocylindrales bacterium]|nr:excalibur calcium-binding domain-containing protein [Candidatus Limnocylindrales bacterium]